MLALRVNHSWNMCGDASAGEDTWIPSANLWALIYSYLHEATFVLGDRAHSNNSVLKHSTERDAPVFAHRSGVNDES